MFFVSKSYGSFSITSTIPQFNVFHNKRDFRSLGIVRHTCLCLVLSFSGENQSRNETRCLEISSPSLNPFSCFSLSSNRETLMNELSSIFHELFGLIIVT